MTRICSVTAEIELVIKWLQDGKRPPGEEISSMGPTMGKFWSKFDQNVTRRWSVVSVLRE